jgi:hypothetical protein
MAVLTGGAFALGQRIRTRRAARRAPVTAMRLAKADEDFARAA